MTCLEHSRISKVRPNLAQRLFVPVDGASLGLFRIAFGLILLWQVHRYFRSDLIERYWIEPTFHFTYPGFSWVKPWAGNGMYYHVSALGILAGLITLGVAYRIACILFFFGFTHLFLLEQALYLNHYYFVSLVSFLMIFVSADRCFSVARLGGGERRDFQVPLWSIVVLRAQIGIVYFYGGLAKLNSDWIHGEPVTSWLRDKASTPVVGPIFEIPHTFLLISWAGLALDLCVVPLLLWRRTRWIAFIAATCFHLLNAWFFHIGIFPWFSIAITTLFFPPDWPRKAAARVKDLFARKGEDRRGVPADFTEEENPRAAKLPCSREPGARSRFVPVLLGVYFAVQLLVPLRHWLYPGDVAWTEEGHQFSWRMKLRDKTGTAAFIVTDPKTNESWAEPIEKHLKKWQAKAMVGRPELLRQFARHVGDHYFRELGRPVEVRVRSIVSLNARPSEVMIDPNVDLAHEPYRIGPAPWVTRLKRSSS